ncbi:MAG: TIGR03067 domain-containing protein [Gemmataceae bacterium]|nr:TIGR03067 domain-containing protein [Gemmataceae bacterium]
MRVFTAATVAVMLAAVMQVRGDKFDTSKVEGAYEIVSGKSDGKPIPEREIKGSLVTIGKDAITGTDKDRKMFFACTYTIDDTTKPWTIRMVATEPKKGEKAEGVIAWEGKELKLCYNLPGGKVPTAFDAGEKQHCFVLRKKK